MRIASFSKMRLPRVFKGILLVAAGIATCLHPMRAFGQTNSAWNGGTGNWSNATDWTPNQVPNNSGGTTYNVTIDSSGGDDVTLDQNAIIASLTLGATSIAGIGSTLAETPGSPETLTVVGGVTVNETGFLAVYDECAVAAASFTNSGSVLIEGSRASTLTITGTLTNSLSGNLLVGGGTSGVGVANIGNLDNMGQLFLYQGATVNLTNQPNGITDIPSRSLIQLIGTINAGSHNGLANLTSVEGTLELWNGKSLALSSNTLTVESGGTLDLANGSALSVTNLTNSGGFVSTGNIDEPPFATSLTVTGTFVNTEFATLNVALNGTAVVNIGTLDNDGTVKIDAGGTLQVTSFGTMVGPKYSVPQIDIANDSKLIIDGASATLAGNGRITMRGGMITGAAAGDVLTNDMTIVGFGIIGDNSLGLVNGGVINATGKGNVLTIDPSSAGFNNEGALTVGAGVTLDITGPTNSFLNFDSATGTLTGGRYNIGNGTLRFDNANIVTNAAFIILSGPQSQILNQTGGNGLTNFATNSSAGTFVLEGDRNFTTIGAFSNAGTLTISKGSTFTVGRTKSYTQTAGAMTVSGTLSVSSPGGLNLSGGSILDSGTITTGSFTETGGTTSVSGTLAASSNYSQTGGNTIINGHLIVGSAGVNVSGGSVFGIGTITGNIDLTGGLLSPGAASKKAGELTVSGTYTQSGAGAFDVDLGGTTAGTQYDVLNITSTATLGGVLNVDLISGFKPAVGETFDIMDFTSEAGTFTTLDLPKLTDGDTWSISYNATDVVLTVDGPAATQGAVSASAAKRVSRGLVASKPANTQHPAAILSRAACFAERLIGAASCNRASVNALSHGPEMRAGTSASAGEVHNNITIATRSISSERGGTSHGTSATTMARFYVCAYFPSSVARTMGCN